MATRVIMNISPTCLTVNLDTMSPDRRRESLCVGPREQREVTDEQFRSRELQKLLGAKFFVDVTAAGDRRRKREQELGIG